MASHSLLNFMANQAKPTCWSKYWVDSPLNSSHNYYYDKGKAYLSCRDILRSSDGLRGDTSIIKDADEPLLKILKHTNNHSFLKNSIWDRLIKNHSQKYKQWFLVAYEIAFTLIKWNDYRQPKTPEKNKTWWITWIAAMS